MPKVRVPQYATQTTTVIKMEMEIGETTLKPTQINATPKPLSEDLPLYQQRKCMLSEYKELFSALFRLPDKEVQKKVLNCINAKYQTVATQTNPVEIREISEITTKEEKKPIKEELKKMSVNKSPSLSDSCSEGDATKSPKPVLPKKRKRKRKISLPQANKVSRVAVAKSQQLVKLNKPQPEKQIEIADGNSSDFNSFFVKENLELKRFRTESSDFSDNCSVNLVFEDIQTRSKEQLFQLFLKDTVLADKCLENGLLPIQEAVVKSQNVNLNRHIFIWKDWKKTDLNDILTEEGEDLLQLGIIHNCLPETVKLLIDKGLHTNTVDDEGNSVLHLAVLHDVHKHLMLQLIERIDLKILMLHNDEGFTALHLAVRKDCYLLAECILNVMDKRLSGKQFYNREHDIIETDEKVIKQNFQDYYEKVCLEMEINDDNTNIIDNHEQKQQLLQAVDKRSGNTALFFAIENQLEHLVYLLLAHLTDPRTENFSGQDCKSFFSEYCKTLNLSLNIDSAMEKVTKLLS